MSSLIRTQGSACAWTNCVGYVDATAGSNGRSVEKVNDPSRYRGKKVGAVMTLTSTPVFRSCAAHEYEKLLMNCQRFSSRPCGMLYALPVRSVGRLISGMPSLL